MKHKTEGHDPVDELELRTYARSGRDRGKRVDEIVDEIAQTKGTVHMVRGGEYSGAKFYGKVGDMETMEQDDVNIVTEWVKRQLKRSREIAWRKMLRVRYSRSGEGVDDEGKRYARRRNFDVPDHEGKVEIELQVEVLMIGYHQGAGWRELSVEQFENKAVEDKLKASQKASLPSAVADLRFPYRPPEGGYYSEKNWLWTEYDEGLHQSLRAIQDVIINARKSVAKLLGDDGATARLATIGAAAIPKLLGAGGK